MLCDAVDVSEEAHVQHAVGLIEDEDIEFAQVHITEVHVADHAARSHNGDVHACGQGVFFAVEITAASPSIDGHAGCAREISESFTGLVDLECKFPGGCDDQALDVIAPTGFMDVVHRGQQECRCFSGAGLGDANEVLSFGNRRYGHGLDGRGQLESHGIQTILDGVAEGQFREGDFLGFLGRGFFLLGFLLGVPGQRFLRLGFLLTLIGPGRILWCQLLVGGLRINHKIRFRASRIPAKVGHHVQASTSV